MKKSILILGVCMIIIISIPIIMYINILLTHIQIMESAENYPEQTFLSDNGDFILCTHVVSEDDTTYVTFYIKKASDDNIVFQCEDKYRAYDLKGVEWDNMNVVVESSDVGEVIYLYEDGVWTK